ncbi:hypothetical protein E4U14_001914 [Claviceps sp. LM454 group G7]|nr:hypothetical protein E4U14_001914 [Claviceps sp. LM454 group G7]
MRIRLDQVPKQQSFSNVLIMPSPGDPKPHQPQRPPGDEDAGKRATRIIDTQTSENTQTRMEEKLDDLTKGVADIRSKVCDDYMKRCVESEKQLKTKNKEEEGLRSEIQSLKAQLQQENADRQDKVEQLQKKSTEAKGLRSELQSLREQLQRQKAISKEKVDELATTIQRLDEDKKLRKVIQGNALRLTISDDEIRERFVNLREQIKALANSAAYDLNRKHVFPRTLGGFTRKWNSLSPGDRVFHLRAVIHNIIHRHILSRDIFGLEESPLSRGHHRDMKLDDALGDFEGLLRENEVKETFISDWRLSTLKCIGTFRPALRDRSAASSDIWNVLEAFARHGQDSPKLFAEIRQLCDNAFTLRLLTRQSDDRYQFEIPDEYDPEKGSNVDAFLFCSALVKYTVNEDTEISRLLEPPYLRSLLFLGLLPEDAEFYE